MISGMAIVAFDRSVLKVNQAILMTVIVVGYVVGLAYPADRVGRCPCSP